MPIEPSDAVKAAYEYLLKVAGGDASHYSNFRVEEVKQDTEQNYHITLSYEFMGEFPFEKKREYKDFVINKNDGIVISMVIRKI